MKTFWKGAKSYGGSLNRVLADEERARPIPKRVKVGAFDLLLVIAVFLVSVLSFSFL